MLVFINNSGSLEEMVLRFYSEMTWYFNFPNESRNILRRWIMSIESYFENEIGT